jgi:dihydroflavonol-4-reductase
VTGASGFIRGALTTRLLERGDQVVGLACSDVEVVAVNPSSVRGPPRTGSNGGIIVAYLNGKLPAFVDTHGEVVDIQDCIEGHLLAAERGETGQRYVRNGATLQSLQALEIVSELSARNPNEKRQGRI